MRLPLLGALPCLLFAQTQPPLTFSAIQAKARPSPDHLRAEARLAEGAQQLQETRGFLREGPLVAFSAGPRRSPGVSATTDRGFELEVPLFFGHRRRADLESALGQAHPLLKEAARREGCLRLRAAYLEAWLAARTLALREADTATVEQWLKAARARHEAGADPGFQVSLVEGELLKARHERDEARLLAAQAWSALAALADLPGAPQPLADPGAPPPLPPGDLGPALARGPLRQALVAQAELATRSLRLKEAQARSRWSLRGAHAQEGEERVTRLGFAVRLPRPGELDALRRSTEAQLASQESEARQALAELEGRTQALLSRLAPAEAEAPSPDFAQALTAVELRLREGRERPSEALPIRRQLLEAQLAGLRRTVARQLLSAELQSLLPEVNP